MPNSMKRTYKDSTNMLPNYSDVSNDTSEQTSNKNNKNN